MRLWTLHPRYLDARGLVAVWREGLLAQSVLAGTTQGYRHHPQLLRFRAQDDPSAAIATYLAAVLAEAQQRGYAFDGAKIGEGRIAYRIEETRGQLCYEWSHLLGKLKQRHPTRFQQWAALSLDVPEPHPLFMIIDGDIQHWERR